jgi:cell division protein FtsB
MKIIDRVKPIALYIWRSNYLKYVIVVLFCVLLIGFLDENSVWHHIRNQQRIGELKDEIELYNKRHKRNQAKIRELDRNPEAIEKIARERYFMKADDEDIFVIRDGKEELEDLGDETIE